jgi:anti-anti-sigma factor
MVASQNPSRDDLADIEVEYSAARAPAFAAVLTLCGEHDVATSDGLREALAAIHGHVLVDLSDCDFVDSSVLSVLLRDSHTRGSGGQRLELLVPVANVTVSRTLEVSGVAQLLTVHGSAVSVAPAT